eukprot:53780-Prorocentrum_minimum.AAC.1
MASSLSSWSLVCAIHIDATEPRSIWCSAPLGSGGRCLLVGSSADGPTEGASATRGGSKSEGGGGLLVWGGSGSAGLTYRTPSEITPQISGCRGGPHAI